MVPGEQREGGESSPFTKKVNIIQTPKALHTTHLTIIRPGTKHYECGRRGRAVYIYMYTRSHTLPNSVMHRSSGERPEGAPQPGPLWPPPYASQPAPCSAPTRTVLRAELSLVHRRRWQPRPFSCSWFSVPNPSLCLETQTQTLTRSAHFSASSL